jgi:hypothetical protein
MLFVGAKFKMIFALLSVACAVQTTCKVDEMVARMPLALNEDSAGNEESDTTEVTSGPVQEKLSFPHGGTQANGTASVTETHRQPEGQAEQANTTQPSIVTPVVDGAEVAQLEGEGTLFDNGIAQSSLVEPSQFSSGMSQPLCYQFQQAEKRLPEAGEKCCKERSLTPETQYTCNTYDWCIRACPLVLKEEAGSFPFFGKTESHVVKPECREKCDQARAQGRTDLACLQEFGVSPSTFAPKPWRQFYCCPPGQRYDFWGGACTDDSTITEGDRRMTGPYKAALVPEDGAPGSQWGVNSPISMYDDLGNLRPATPPAGGNVGQP